METSPILKNNVAFKIVDMLVNAGVKRVYGITGDSLNPINDAVRRDGRLQWIHVRNEEAGAYAASMEAELNGIACCMGSSGPGHVHLVNGLYDANRAGNPVIAIASTIATNLLGLDNFQETRPEYLFADCSKYVFMSNTAEQAINGLQTAIQHAISKKGVAVLGLPSDVSTQKFEKVATSNFNFKPASRVLPSLAEMKELADLLNSNKKVCLFAGHGCMNAKEEVLELAKLLNAPLAFTLRGKIIFDYAENENAVGLNGMLGNKGSFDAMQDADVLVMLGTDYPYSDFLPEKVTIAQIDIQPARLGRRAKVDYGYCGDIQSTLEELIPMIKQKSEDEYLKKHRKQYLHAESEYLEFVTTKAKEDKIHPEYVANLINEMAEDNAIFTTDTGMSTVWAAHYLRAGKGRYLTGSYNHGSMANAMPMAMGAQLARPDRQVIAFCGDGGFSMLMGDLMTISQYKLPVKLIIFNNRQLGMVELEMRVEGYMEYETNMVNPDFVKLAESMGVSAWQAEKTDEVKPALEAAFAHDGPALVNVFTDPNALVMPAHVTFDEVAGYARSMGKLMTNGQIAHMVEVFSDDVKYLREII